jgi:hypothetical protein
MKRFFEMLGIKINQFFLYSICAGSFEKFLVTCHWHFLNLSALTNFQLVRLTLLIRGTDILAAGGFFF